MKANRFSRGDDRCAELLGPELDRSLLSLFDPQAGSLLDQTGYTQPVMFALEYALATLWQSWGIEPVAVLGHSVGEFVAACVAGVYTLEDGIRLIAQRARLMQALPRGGCMAAVFATEQQVTAALEPYRDQIAIAALNGPESIVISGDASAVNAVMTGLETQGVKSKPLTTSHAFHSQRMDPMLDALRQAAAAVAYSKPKIDIVANLTGQVADEHTFADPSYWSRHARSPVRFAQSMQVLADRGCEVFLEIGPSPTLIGMGRRCLMQEEFAWLPSLRPRPAMRNAETLKTETLKPLQHFSVSDSQHLPVPGAPDDWQSMLDSLGQLYVRGAKIDWAGFDRHYPRCRVSLPTYPFQRKRYWSGLAPDASAASVAGSSANGHEVHPLLGRRVIAAVREQVFEQRMSVHRPATLADHKIQGKAIMPGAAYLEMALAAGVALTRSTGCPGMPWSVRDMSLVEPLLLDKVPKTVQTIVTPEGPQAASVRIVSLAAGNGEGEPTFVTHAVGRLTAPSGGDQRSEVGDQRSEVRDQRSVVNLESIRARFTGEARDVAWRREALRKSGLEPGPTFFWLVLHWTNPREALGELRPPCEADRADQYHVHPGLLDSVFQLLGSILPGAGTGIDAYVPMAFESWQCFEMPQGPLWALASLTSFDGNLAVGNIDLIDASGSRVVAKMEGASLRRVSRDWLARLVAGPLPDWCYELAWTPQPLSMAAVEATALEPGRWLVFDSCDGVGGALAERLRMKGHDCVLVPARISPESRRTAVEEFLAAPGGYPGSAVRGIVYLTGLESSRHSPCAVRPVASAAAFQKPEASGGRQTESACYVEAPPDFAAARRDGWARPWIWCMP